MPPADGRERCGSLLAELRDRKPDLVLAGFHGVVGDYEEPAGPGLQLVERGLAGIRHRGGPVRTSSGGAVVPAKGVRAYGSHSGSDRDGHSPGGSRRRSGLPLRGDLRFGHRFAIEHSCIALGCTDCRAGPVVLPQRRLDRRRNDLGELLVRERVVRVERDAEFSVTPSLLQVPRR